MKIEYIWSMIKFVCMLSLEEDYGLGNASATDPAGDFAKLKVLGFMHSFFFLFPFSIHCKCIELTLNSINTPFDASTTDIC